MKFATLVVAGSLAITGSATPMPPPDAVVDRHFYPARDGTIDHADYVRLAPTYSPRLLYAEVPMTSLAMGTTYAMKYPTVVLESSDLIERYDCDSARETIALRFTTKEAFALAAAWPKQDLVLVTKTPSCNPDDERGVYLANAAVMDRESLELTVKVQRTSWKDTATTMTVEYLDVDPQGAETKPAFVVQGKRSLHDQVEPEHVASSVQSCVNINPVEYICNAKGHVASAARLQPVYSAGTFAQCRNDCLANPRCISFGFSNKQCGLFTKGIRDQGFKPDPTSPIVYYNRHCFKCTALSSTTSAKKTTMTAAATSTKHASSSAKHLSTSKKPSSSSKSTASTKQSQNRLTTAPHTTASPSSTHISLPNTPPTTLNAAQKVIYSSILSGISYNSNGYISGSISGATTSRAAAPVTADPANTSAQASLQNKLALAGLAPATQVFSSAAAQLSSAGLAASPSAINSFDDGSGSDTNSKRQVFDAVINNGTSSASLFGRSRLVKRYSFYDFLSDFNDYACPFISCLCEACEDACDGLESGLDTYESISCLAAHCLDPKQGDTIAQYTYDTPWSFSLTMNPGVVKNANKSQLSCTKCGINISNFQLAGGFTVDLTQYSVLAFSLTATMSSVATFAMSVDSGGADSSSWSYVMNAWPLGSITATNIFTLSPQVLYTIGASWSTTSATTYSTGATITMSGATLQANIYNNTVSSFTGWQPTISIVAPDYETTDAVTLNPYMQTSIQMNIQVFGITAQSALSINTQVLVGQSGGLVTLANAGLSYCPAGEFQTTNFDSINNYIDFSGSTSVSLYTTTSTATPICSSVPPNPPSPAQVTALATYVNGPAFCTSLISYTPPVATITTTSTTTIATSTVSVVGGTGTTTITPEAVPGTTTVYVSVSSYVANKKRDVPRTAMEAAPTTEAIPGVAAHVLLPRRFVPTPAILKSWTPQQVTEACSSIATGTVNTTSTTIATTSFGVTTDTIEATATAATPTSYTTITSYVPAASPTNLLPTGDFNSWLFPTTVGDAMGVSASGSKYLMGDIDLPNGYGFETSAPAQYYGAAMYNFTNLEVGWTYALSFGTLAVHSTTNTCKVFYYLDDYLIHQFNPIADNGYSGHISDAPAGPTDGPYFAQPTAATQLLTVSVTCAEATIAVAWATPTFYGPTDD